MSAAALGRTQLEIDGDGAPVVFIHGLAGTSNFFQPLLSAFGGFRCIRPDLPGSGRSPRPHAALSIDLFVETVGEILRSVAGAPAHLVAHSMGTLIAQHVVVRWPESVRSLTLFGPIAEPAESARERLRERARLARQDGMVDIAEALSQAGLSTASRTGAPIAVAFVRESYMRQDAEGYAQSCEALAGARGADTRLIRCPTLMVTGDEDAIAPPGAVQALAERIKGAKVKVLHRCGHWTTIEAPSDCAKLASEHVRAHALA
jgi:3-oxoadipate enol-lactonase